MKFTIIIEDVNFAFIQNQTNKTKPPKICEDPFELRNHSKSPMCYTKFIKINESIIISSLLSVSLSLSLLISVVGQPHSLMGFYIYMYIAAASYYTLGVKLDNVTRTLDNNKKKLC